MAAAYPAALATLSTTGQRPLDGRPLLAVHFNRLFAEILALEATLGIGNVPPRGAKADFKTRINAGLNDSGTVKQELLCEDDPSGNQRATARFWAAQQRNVTFNPKNVAGAPPDGFFRLPYAVYDDEPPAFLACVARLDAGGFSDAKAILNIDSISQIAVVLDCRTQAGAAPGVSDSETVWSVALSRNLRIYDDNAKWVVPIGRSGS